MYQPGSRDLDGARPLHTGAGPGIRSALRSDAGRRCGLLCAGGLLAAVLAGCAMLGPTPVPQATEQRLWPAPPDQPRFLFEGTLRSAADIAIATMETSIRQMLDSRPAISDQPVIYKPSGIVVRGGLVYVTEPAASAVTVFDIPRGKVFRFGWREPNALKQPQSIALDAEGLAYVLDSALRRVMVFDDLGLFKFSIDVNQGFTNPVAVTVSPDGQTIYVVDHGDLGNADHKVVAFTPAGQERFRLGPRGGEDGRFNIPLAASVAPDGTLYVVDTGNFRIQAFDASGKFRFSFGDAGTGLGQFSRPRAIALDAAGNVYVSDSGFNNVQIFNAQGELLMPLGGGGRKPGAGKFALIAGIALDETNRLYIVDHYFRKIEVYRRLSDEEGLKLAISQ